MKNLLVQEIVETVKSSNFENPLYLTGVDFLETTPVTIEHDSSLNDSEIEIIFLEDESIEILTESEREKIKLINCSYSLLGLLLDLIK